MASATFPRAGAVILGLSAVWAIGGAPVHADSYSNIPRVNTFNYLSGETSQPTAAAPQPAKVAADAKPTTADKAEPPATVGLLEAVKSGAVEAKVVARDAHHLRVFLRNPGKTPLTVELPPVLAARPVLAQQNFFNPGGQQNGFDFTGRGSSGGTQTQAVSGPSPFGISANASNNNQGANIFAIPPESTRQLRVATVCVEHGKPNPRSTVKYELARPEDVGVGPELAAVLAESRDGGVDRDVLQAAAWHLANAKSWDELRDMSRMAAVNARAPLFTSPELAAARRLVDAAAKKVAREKATPAAIVERRPESPEEERPTRRLPVSAKKL